jgi:hypothetical protein
VIPIRMTEAWLLLDEEAIRDSAGRPSSSVSLGLPLPQRVETIPDPKQRFNVRSSTDAGID